jgi:murein DD-endopeptidase MepM/ murein hydrolase activator NlpD
MPKSQFSVIIVPDDTGKVIEKKIAKWKLVSALVFASLFVIVSGFFAFGYFKSNIDSQKLSALEEENLYLAGKVTDLQRSVEHIKGQMSNIIETDENIRLIFDLPTIDPSIREVGIGGPEYGVIEFNTPPASELSFVEQDIDKILRQIKLENASFEDIYNKVQDRKHILDHTPSIIPCDGFITSGLGRRRDPFTGLMAQHNGIDIATSKGTPIYAPAAGVVKKCGWDRGMGNFVVINHGYNLKTYYGHLSLIKVREGQKIHRMDVIGTVGSTGRSTGPHLHYEVRQYNRPVNPRDYFVKSIIYKS